MIKIKNGVKKYDNHVLLDPIDLDISSCGIHAFIGESGCGKTTLLNIIAGFDTLSEGSIQVDGKIATIFQSYELIDELNVKENIYLGVEINHSISKRYEEIILQDLGLIELFDQYPHELSGGQKQRVGIARALMQAPSIILCDEPTESLDIDNKNQVMKLLKHLSKSCIVVLVSHDMSVVEPYCDSIYEIFNQTIQPIKLNQQLPPITYQHETSLQKQVLHQQIKKIIFKRSGMISLMIGVLIMGIGCLMAFDQLLFGLEPTLKGLTQNMIYIEGELPESFIIENELNSITTFSSFSDGTKNYKTKILPTNQDVIQQFLIEGRNISNLEVVINDALASKLGKDIINQEITLFYTIQHEEYSMTTQIVGIVNEDLQIPVMYYLENNFEDYLKNQKDQDGMSLYDLMTLDSFYSDDIAYSRMNILYQLYAPFYADIDAPLYEQWQQEKEDRLLFQYIFDIIKYFIGGMMLFCILIVTHKDIEKIKQMMAVQCH